MEDSRRLFFKQLGAAIGTVVIASLPKKSIAENLPEKAALPPTSDPFVALDREAGAMLNYMDQTKVCPQCGVTWDRHFANHPVFTTAVPHVANSSTYMIETGPISSTNVNWPGKK